MVALYVILAIIAIIVILFCIKVKVTAIYEGNFTLDVQWLFIKKRIYPESDDDKAKKEKKAAKKAEKEKNKKPKPKKEEQPKDPNAPKSGNIFSDFYKNQGFGATIDLIKTAAEQIGGFLKGVYRAFTIENLTLLLKVAAGDDAAQTAIKYGKVCSAVYPSMGFICSNMRVKEYDANVIPDFVNHENDAIFNLKLSVVPIKLTNAVVVLIFRLLFKVLIKLLKGSRKNKKTV